MDAYALARELLSPKSGPVFGRWDGDFKLPKDRVPVGFDDPGVERVYNFLRANGLRVTEVPQRYLLENFKAARKEDAIGYLLGDNVYVATDYKGRPLQTKTKKAVALHELGHYRKGKKESDAQKEALRIAADEFPDEEAHKQIREFGRAYGWLN